MRDVRVNLSEILQKVQEDVKRLVKGFSEMDVAAFAMGRWNPPADVLEGNEDILIVVELPGLTQSEVEVTVAGGEVKLSGFKPSSREGSELRAVMTERGSGQFQRVFELPSSIDAEKITATMANGLLEIRMPKKAESVRKEVKIDVK